MLPRRQIKTRIEAADVAADGVSLIPDTSTLTSGFLLPPEVIRDLNRARKTGDLR